MKSELEGFKTATRDLELQVQQTARVNFTLELGTISETATVTGVSPLVETSNATVGTVIENRRIVELPLNGRNYLQLVALSPNVSAEFAGAGQAGDRQGGTRANQQLSISGQRREFNYYTLDGVDNTDVNFNTYIFLPSVDALEEFKVQTGVYSAEFGREASQVNVVTKSGIERPARHGVRVPPRRCARREAVRVHRRAGRGAEGAVQVGSVRLHGRRPGLEEPACSSCRTSRATRIEKQFQTLYSVPSVAMRNGDFSELLGQPRRDQPADRAAEPASSSTRRSARSSARRGPASRLPATSFPASRLQRHLEAAARVLSRAEQRHRALHQQLPLAPGSRDRQVPVHAADGLRPELRIDLDGPLQLRQGERGVAGAEVERHQAEHERPSGRARQHLDAVVDARQRIPVRLQLLLQHLRTRAGVRARRRQGAGHPGHLD